MKATFKLDDVDAVQATMTLTMPVGEWRKLKKIMPSEWPGWDLSRNIGDLIRHAEAHFYTTPAEAGE